MELLTRLLSARDKSREDHVQKEVVKRGVLRAGSTGMMSDEGEFAGACPRTSLLRSKGIEADPPTPQAYIMFELGYANEDVILKQIQETLKPGEIVLKEEEIPIEWMTPNGTKVTGRPDLVICDEVTKKPLVGIELKSVHSLWTARDVLFGRKPKLANLAQSAHYMWKLGVPEYKLMYKSYSQLGQGMAGNEWITKMFPKPGEPDSEFIDYTESAKQEGKYTIKHIKQFEIVYDLSFDKNGRLRYRVEGNGVWTPTIITQESIAKYFDFVSRMETDKALGPMPIAVDALGSKQNYTPCKYCPLHATCKENQTKGYDKWMAEVIKITSKNKKTKLSY